MFSSDCELSRSTRIDDLKYDLTRFKVEIAAPLLNNCFMVCTIAFLKRCQYYKSKVQVNRFL